MVAPAVPHELQTRVRSPGGPSLTGRALLALAFLVGFYALAVAVVAVLVGFNVALYSVAGRTSVPLLLLTVFVTWAVVKGVFFVTRATDTEDEGVGVDERGHPEFVRMVRDVAKDLETAPPDRILLVPEVNAAVRQADGMLGLRHGERVMVVGIPLIDALTVDQLRGVIAHEMALYAGGDTRLGGLTYRVAASIHRTVDHLGDGRIASLFEAYGKQYMRLSLRVRRQQELSADAAAVRLAGREGHVSALRRIETSAYAFNHFLRSYMAPLWWRGYDADNAFEGYRALLADPDRQEELASLESELHTRETARFDSHPSLAERVAHAQRCPEGPTAGCDSRPALALFDQPDEVERQVARLMTRQLTGREMPRALSWDRGAAEVYGDGVCADGDVLLRVAGQVAGQPGPASLADALELVEDGRAGELAVALSGDLDDMHPDKRAEARSQLLHHHLESAMSAYLVAERGHRWVISWSGPLGLVDGKGNWKDVPAMTSAFLEDPRSGSKLRRSLGGVARLAAFRVAFEEDEDAASVAPLPDIVHIQPDVRGRRRQFDAVLFTNGLVLHPVAGGVGHALRRLMATQSFGRPDGAAAQRRLETLFDQPADVVLGGAPGAIVINLADIRNLRHRRSSDIEIDISSDPKAWRLRCPSKTHRDALLKAMNEQLLAQIAPGGPVPVAA